MKVTTDGTSGDGSPLHTEWMGKFDGKDYPLTGEPSAETRSYKKVDDHTLTLENKKEGVVTTSGRIVVFADGKTRTLTASGKTSAGKKVTGKSVYRQSSGAGFHPGFSNLEEPDATFIHITCGRGRYHTGMTTIVSFRYTFLRAHTS